MVAEGGASLFWWWCFCDLVCFCWRKNSLLLTRAHAKIHTHIHKQTKQTNERQTRSGYNRLKAEAKFDASKHNARFHKDEHFKRISCGAFVRLLATAGGAEPPSPVVGTGPTALSPIAEADGKREKPVDVLILDLRTAEDFEQCRISGSVSYPVAMLHRATNPFTAEVLSYANQQPGKLIVLYDADERIAAGAANLMFEKGIDNVCMLSGGLAEFANRFPEMVLGELPESLRRAPPRISAASRHAAARGRLVSSSSASSAMSVASYRSSASSAWR